MNVIDDTDRRRNGPCTSILVNVARTHERKLMMEIFGCCMTPRGTLMLRAGFSLYSWVDPRGCECLVSACDLRVPGKGL